LPNFKMKSGVFVRLSGFVFISGVKAGNYADFQRAWHYGVTIREIADGSFVFVSGLRIVLLGTLREVLRVGFIAFKCIICGSYNLYRAVVDAVSGFMGISGFTVCYSVVVGALRFVICAVCGILKAVVLSFAWFSSTVVVLMSALSKFIEMMMGSLTIVAVDKWFFCVHEWLHQFHVSHFILVTSFVVALVTGRGLSRVLKQNMLGSLCAVLIGFGTKVFAADVTYGSQIYLISVCCVLGVFLRYFAVRKPVRSDGTKLGTFYILLRVLLLIDQFWYVRIVALYGRYEVERRTKIFALDG